MESRGWSASILRLALVALVMGAFAISSATASAAWSVSTLSLPPSTTESALNSVDCTGEVCWAVGDYSTGGSFKPLAYQPLSNTYATPPSPGNSAELTDISCASNNFCMAVGRFVNGTGNNEAFAEKWTATTGWTLQTMTFPSGNFSSELGSVSCFSSSECMAVGDYHKPSPGIQYLAEHWTSGGGWVAETPAEATGIGYQALTAISCPAASKCVAVGSYRRSPWGVGDQRMETDTYNSGWSVPNVNFWPGSGSLPYIGDDSCFSLTNCMGVGFYTTSSSKPGLLAYEKVVGSPDWTPASLFAISESDLHGVYCPTATTSCYVVGREIVSGVSKPLALHLAGGTWSVLTLPTITEGSFGRVACIGEGVWCVAVGRTGTKALVETGP